MPKKAANRGTPKRSYSKKTWGAFLSSPHMKEATFSKENSNMTEDLPSIQKKTEIPSTDSSSSETSALSNLTEEFETQTSEDEGVLPKSYSDKGGLLAARVSFLNQNIPYLDIPKVVSFHVAGYKHSRQDNIIMDLSLIHI